MKLLQYRYLFQQKNLFYLLNFNYIGICISIGMYLMSHKAKYVRNFVQLVVGLSFGIFNMMTWFGFNIKDW